MSRDKKKSNKRRDPRRWVSTVTEDVPQGPQGQPSHEAGTEVHVVQVVDYGDLGRLAFPAASPSTLLLIPAEAHLKRAAKLQRRLPSQTKEGKWSQPFADRNIANRDLLFAFFQEAMAGVLLAHASLDAFANEVLPDGFAFSHKGQELDREALEKRGLELRLSAAAAEATGEPNLMTADPTLWNEVVALKNLRDDIAHAKSSVAYSSSTPDVTIFARLLNHPDLLRLVVVVDQVKGYYGPKVVRTYQKSLSQRGLPKNPT